MPGTDDPKLHVSGRCRLSSSSVQVELRPGHEGVVDEPDLFVLELGVHEPEVGDARVIEREVGWTDEVGAGIKRVRIQGATSAVIDVIDAV